MERILDQEGFTFERVADDRCNSGGHIDDWQLTETNATRDGLRRFWFAMKRIGLFREIADRARHDSHVIRYAWNGPSLIMEGHTNPVSITFTEFEFLRTFVAHHRLRNGYEMATAFGISALAASLGMQTSAGRLVTMDAYAEEKHNNCFGYSAREVHRDADGLRAVHTLRNWFGLEAVLHPTVGWSPDDTDDQLRTVFVQGRDRLDYVFIDGLHEPAQIQKDFAAVLPWIDRDRFAVFFHDAQVILQDDALVAFIETSLGQSFKLVAQTADPLGFNLACVTNLPVPETTADLRAAFHSVVRSAFARHMDQQAMLQAKDSRITGQDNRITELDSRIALLDAEVSKLNRKRSNANREPSA